MRKLQSDDLRDLKGILNRLKKMEAFTPAEVECALELLQIVLDQPDQQDYQVLVADNEDRPAGYILYGPVPLTDGNFDIYWIATDPKFHGEGFGRQLMEAAELDMQHQGARMICLETSSQRSYLKTRNFYEKSGYRKESVIADFYSPGDDRITYIKRFS
ncbi:GNAT family N-acetyltransferase [uncultured Desulfuromusa sp.]|uniref:GNAT family N-acetyltransferase n=1 Tax=uncultured Desulfuromusa sp. TaxID=219183 RepID=UPI002AA89EF1|nr:GNAT family N-acetyltransferase [uncultured Desulfuromusa sp.]